jgi:hypothetical protein
MSRSETSFTIHDLPAEERPRERLVKFGPDALSSVELLALIIGRGIPGRSALTIAHELLKEFKSVKGVSEATIEELSAVKGIGAAKAAQLRASFELGRRQDLYDEPATFEITNPGAVVKAIRASIQDKAALLRSPPGQRTQAWSIRAKYSRLPFPTGHLQWSWPIIIPPATRSRQTMMFRLHAGW